MQTSHAGYLRNIFQSRTEFKKTVRKAARALKPMEFDVIVCTGVSGVTFGSALAYSMDKILTVVRKEHEQNHSGRTVEGIPTEPFKYLFVDDLIDSGTTLVNVLRALDQHQNSGTCIGGYCYHTNTSRFCTNSEMHDRAYGFNKAELKLLLKLE